MTLGSGLAGLRTAIDMARARGAQTNIALVLKPQIMLTHSVCAEGGTAAVLRPGEGDSLGSTGAWFRRSACLSKRPVAYLTDGVGGMTLGQ